MCEASLYPQQDRNPVGTVGKISDFWVFGVRIITLILIFAGVIAEAEAQVVAHNIVSEMSGSPKEEFNGKGYCFMEVGFTKATTVEVDFFAEPNPVSTPIAEPSEEYKRRKIEFEKERIARWLQ